MIQSSNIPTNLACKAFDVSQSGFYKWRKRPNKKNSNVVILTEIRLIKCEFLKYGYRRVTKELHRRGIHVNSKKVLKLMKENSLVVKKKRYKPKTTNSNHNLPRHDNLVKNKIITGINQVWVSDITYISIENEFAYLALIMDLASRRIVGLELSRDMTIDLTITALNKAVKQRGVKNVKGCIHHSDHGVQYLARDYITRLEQLGMQASMGEVGNSYDNAHAESLNKTIKNEEVWTNEYESFMDAYTNIARYVHIYNEKRLHSSIGYIPPNEFEKNKV